MVVGKQLSSGLNSIRGSIPQSEASGREMKKINLFHNRQRSEDIPNTLIEKKEFTLQVGEEDPEEEEEEEDKQQL